MKEVDVKNIPVVGSIIITEDFKRKIDYLHKQVGKLEWSGILLYKLVSGSISKMSNLVFKAVDIYPMDIGSASNTAFEYKPEDVVNMYDSIPEAMELNTGLVHSHNAMSSFISGTDFNEIKNNAGNYNFYVSLVVSFDQEYVCKIAFPSQTVIKKTSKVRDNKGKWVTVTHKEESESLLLGDLNVVFAEFNKLEDWFTNKVADIKKVKARTVARTYTHPTYDKAYGLPNRDYSTGQSYYKYNEDNWNKPSVPTPPVNYGVGRTHWNSFDEDKGMGKTFESMFPPKVVPMELEEVEDKVPLTSVEKFFMAIMTHDVSGMDDFDSTDVREELASMIEWERIDWQYFLQELEANIYIGHEDVYGPDDNNHIEHLKEVVNMIESIGGNEKNIKKLVRHLRDMLTNTIIKNEIINE